MLLQNIMIAARQFGLETCPKAAFLTFYDVLQKRLRIPAEQTIVCGMALGYPLDDPRDVRALHRICAMPVDGREQVAVEDLPHLPLPLLGVPTFVSRQILLGDAVEREVG